MSQNFKSTGTKISQYPYAEINTTNHKKKFEHSHHFITYAASNYGVAGIQRNYQLGIEALRDDFQGYVGINNAKASWRDYVTIWEGDWYNSNRNRSYVTKWLDSEFGDVDYITNKYGLDNNYDKARDIHRIFMLNTAPWPLEANDSHFTSKTDKNQGTDPNPHTVKFVSKNYVDDRHNGIRKVDVQDYGLTHPSHLTIRPYTCFYQYSKLPEKDNKGCYYINICDDCVLEDGSTFEDKVKYNRLVFYLRLKNFAEFYENDGVHCNNLKIQVNGVDNVVKWSYEDEWTEILREHRLKIVNGSVKNTEKEYIFLKCEAEYINDKFVVTCSSFFGRKKAIKRMVELPLLQEQSVVNIDLSLHENESFVFNVPQDSTPTDPVRSQVTINFDTSKLDDYHMYSWDFFMITGDDKHVHNNTNTMDSPLLDNCEVVFGGTSILWANQDNYNLTPDFQPNKMYCIEFVKAFDGILIGRIKYYISLIKKA